MNGPRAPGDLRGPMRIAVQNAQVLAQTQRLAARQSAEGAASSTGRSAS